MCETKTKKRLFAFFLIPLIIASAFISSAISSPSANAQTATPSSGGSGAQSCANYPGGDPQIIYYFNSDKTQVKQETYGTNADGSDCLIYPLSYQKLLGGGIFREGGTSNVCGNEVQTVVEPGATSVTGNFLARTKTPNSTLCTQTSTTPIAIYKDQASAISAAKVAGQASTTPTGKSTDCSITGIGWILCPVIRFGAGIADTMFNFLSTTFLETNTDLYSTNSATYTAWQWILGFANIIFVIVFLVIIFSQATGFGISNYGIKKMLPKLIIGVILINLSFFICEILVDTSNLLGYGFSKFFDSISSGVPSPTGNVTSSGGLFGPVVDTVLTSLAAAGIIIAAIAFLAPVLLAAVVGLLMIFLFLVARQAIIILAIIVAPLAFAAWLLPNTEKLFKRWWSILMSMLMLFPIIALVFGGSKLASKIVQSVYDKAGQTDAISKGLAATNTSAVIAPAPSFLGQVIGAAILVVPLFAVPFLLKGMMNSVPVIGNAASRLYNGATRGTRNQAQKRLDPAFAALQAKKNAGLANAFGLSRGAQRDKDGNFIRDANGNLIGKNGKPLRRSFAQFSYQTRKSFEDNKASYETVADNSHKERALKQPDTMAGRAARLTQREGVRSAATASGFESELSGEKSDITTQVGLYERARLGNVDIKKDFDLQTTNNYEATLISDPTSAAGRARRSADRQGVRAAAYHEILESELAEEKSDVTTEAGQWERTRLEHAETKKDFDLKTTNNYEDSILNNPTSVAGRARRSVEAQGVRASAISSGFERELSAEKTNRSTQVGQWALQTNINKASQAHSEGQSTKDWKEMQTAPIDPLSAENIQISQDLARAGTTRDSLIRQAQETAGFTQAGNYADNKRQTDFGNILERAGEGTGSAADEALLQIAGGTVDVAGGRKRARAIGVQTGRKIAAENTAAARAVAQSLMDKQQLKIIQAVGENEYGEPLDASGNVISAPNTILENMLRSNDVHEVLAARDEFMTQGQAGVTSGLRTMIDLEDQGTFNTPERQEILAQLKRTQLSEHGKATKENATWAVAWAQGSLTGRQAMLNQDRYLGQTDDQLANQAPSSMLVGIANGAVDQHTAERILSDDRRRSKFDEGQVQMLQMLKDHGAAAVIATWNPDDGKLWSKEKDSSTKKAPTYAEYQAKFKKAREELANGVAISPDPYLVPSDDPESSPDLVEAILPGDKKAPDLGSPTKVLKEFSDKAGGVDRMSRRTFVQFQRSVATASDRDKEDNEDYVALVSQINADVDRRNREAGKINQVATQNVAKGTLSPQRATVLPAKGTDSVRAGVPSPISPEVLSDSSVFAGTYPSLNVTASPTSSGTTLPPTPTSPVAPDSDNTFISAPAPAPMPTSGGTYSPAFETNGAKFAATTSGTIVNLQPSVSEPERSIYTAQEARSFVQSRGGFQNINDTDFNAIRNAAAQSTDISPSTTQFIREVREEDIKRHGTTT